MLKSGRTPRIAHILALDTIGGVERLYADFLRLSQDEFVHITVNDRDVIAPYLAKPITTLSEQVHSIKAWNRFRLPRQPRILRQLNLMRILDQAQPDMIIVWNKPEGLGYRRGSPQVPIVYYEHGACWNARNSPRVKSFLDQVQAVICCSKAALQVLRLQWQLPASCPSYVCHNSISQDIWKLPHLRREKINDRPFRIGLAARLVPLKGVALAIQAFRILRNSGVKAELHIAGTGPEEDNLKQLARNIGVSDIVVFNGLVKDMSEFYANIDCLLCPSLREPFGLVAIEAMATGIPVVGAAVDGLVEVIEPDVTGILIPPTLPLESYEKFGGSKKGVPAQVYHALEEKLLPTMAISPEDIAASLVRLIEDKNFYDSLSKEAYARSRQRFNPDHQVTRLVSTLKTILQTTAT